MSVRRWIGITGIVVAVAGGAVGTGRVGPGSAFEAHVWLLDGTHAQDLPAQVLDERERFLESPEVRDLVHSRLGETPSVWASAASDGTMLVRSRGTTPERAAEATETYATSYVDARRRHIEAEVSAATELVERRTDEIKSQLESADVPQRTSLTELLGILNTQLDQLQGDHYGPGVVGSSPPEPIHDWSWSALFVAGLGAAVAGGADLSARLAARAATR
ncbi:MAG TPA: hypothetical protein VMZ73_08395 [Acidimicrobiales bacterium]|nr:hypothetical protein [Acidimicrobiales bacterium]